MTEHQEQVNLIRWFDIAYPKLKGRLAAIPNASGVGGKQGVILGAKFTREGRRKGFPDLFLPVSAHGFHGLFIEFKRTKGPKPTAEQLEWLDFLAHQGYLSVYCRGFDAAKETIEDYLDES